MFSLAFGQNTKENGKANVQQAILPRGSVRFDVKRGEGVLALTSVPNGWSPDRQEIFQCRETGIVACAWARLDNMMELANALDEPIDGASSDTPRLIARAYQKWGRDSVARMTGDFSFVVYEPNERRIFAAKDPIGVRPLYWCHDDQSSATPSGVIATSIPGIISAAGRKFEIDPGWVARFIAGNSMSRETAAYRHIHKVPPGHWLTIDSNGPKLRRYHEFSSELSDNGMSHGEVIEQYGGLLKSAVRSRLDVHQVNGIETSGGLDSSTIVGLAMLLTDQPEKSLHGFGYANLQGEAEAILTVSQQTGFHNNHIFTGARPTIDEELVWSVLGHPAEHGNSVANYPAYRLAEQLGVQSLISGFGGDEGVTNYAPNFGREMVARRQFSALWRAGGTTFSERARYFGKALYRSNKPSSHARSIMNNAPNNIANIPLRSEVAGELGIAEDIARNSRYDWPIPTVSEFSIHMLNQGFVSTRTESCSLMAANFGLEYSWPLLDTSLLEFFLAAPTETKVRDGFSRALHRDAIKGIVPDERRLAKSKSLGDPVLPMHAFKPKSDPTFCKALEWNALDSMLQDQLDERHVSRLNTIARSEKTDPTMRRKLQPLMRIASINKWLTRRGD